MRKEKYNVIGMTCSACQAHVDKAVREMNGINCVNVNLLSNSMDVEFDENIVSESDIFKAVENAGYGLSKESIKDPKKKYSNDDVIEKMRKRLITSLIFWIPLMYVSMHKMVNLPAPSFMENAVIFGFIQILLLIPIIIVNRNYFSSGFKKLAKRNPNMDSLIAIGSSAAIVYGIYAMTMIVYGHMHNNMELVHRFMHDLYFESAGTILTLITVGKYLETRSKGKTGDAINKLIDLAPKTATIVRENKEIVISTGEIEKGDIVIIKPGNNIPVDGKVIEGESTVDESAITGESMPVFKRVGDMLISGTINKNGYMKIEADKVGEDTTLSQIIKLVEEASNSKAPISRIADRVSGVFVPIVIGIAIIATIIWLILGQSLEFALSIGISIIVISCPCALGLATPVAIMVGTGKGAENGILIKSAEVLENIHNMNTFVFDKTGTITEGKPIVTDIKSLIDEDEFIKKVYSIESNSEHPLAEAVCEMAKSKSVEKEPVENFKAVAGKGIEATINKKKYIGGNQKLLEEYKVDLKEIKSQMDSLSNDGKTVLIFACDNKLIGYIAVADTIKNTSREAIENLKKLDKEIIMITGDNKLVADSIAKDVGIEKVIAEVLPQDKQDEVDKLQKEGKKVCFIGDGINDSPALVKADIGMAIGSGTDIAIESADVVLMKSDLRDVVTAVDLSQKTISNIKLSLFWAFIYNIIGIPIAAGILYNVNGLKLSPMIGAAAMSLSSFCVVSNALRLRFFKPRKTVNKDEEKDNMKTVYVEGMMCEHCKARVEKALSEVEGVLSANVSLKEKKASVELEKEVSDEVLKKAVEDAGYTVKDIK